MEDANAERARKVPGTSLNLASLGNADDDLAHMPGLTEMLQSLGHVG